MYNQVWFGFVILGYDGLGDVGLDLFMFAYVWLRLFMFEQVQLYLVSLGYNGLNCLVVLAEVWLFLDMLVLAFDYV